MTIKPIRSCLAVALLASGAFSAGAGAQSLTLSTTLDPIPAAPAVEKVAPVLDRCWGLSLAASLAAGCRADLSASAPAAAGAPDTAAAGEPVSAASRQADETVPATDETFSGFGLPTLASLSRDRLLRVAREVPIQAGKAMDFLFRFASKYRLRNGEGAWEVSRNTDVVSEARSDASGVKAVGVELLLPFQ